MSIFNLYSTDQNNIGDRSSSPASYFTFPFDVRHMDFLQFCRQFKELDVEGVIFGGGGLLFFREFAGIVDQVKVKKVSWGMGHNTHGAKRVEWPAFMQYFDLHGIRDWGTEWKWVPCASCMHEGFERKYRIMRDIIVYDHHEFSTGINGFPTLNNRAASMDEVLFFLGSAETILTSSYHGAYWGTLLGRRTIIINPFSTKFFNFRFQPIIRSAENWRAALNIAPIYSEALIECRKANLDHFEKVSELFHA